MNGHDKLWVLIPDAIIMAASVFIGFLPYIDKRDRARWARIVLIATGVMGFISYGLDFTLNMHHFPIRPPIGHMLYRLHVMVNGWLCGWLSALLFSGQMLGKIPPKREHRSEDIKGTRLESSL